MQFSEKIFFKNLNLKILNFFRFQVYKNQKPKKT